MPALICRSVLFKNWRNTLWHQLLVIFVDFECLLVKCTTIEETIYLTYKTHENKPMTFCSYIKRNDDVPGQLLNKYDTSCIFSRNENNTNNTSSMESIDAILTVCRRAVKMLQEKMQMKIIRKNE